MRRTTDFESYWKIKNVELFYLCLSIAWLWTLDNPRTDECMTIKEVVCSVDPGLYNALNTQDKRLVGRAFSNMYLNRMLLRTKKVGKRCGSIVYRRF